MKKFLALGLSLVLTMSLVACGDASSTEESVESVDEVVESVDEVVESTEEVTEEVTEDTTEEVADASAVTNYADYVAAEDDTPVELTVYVQDTQSWWNDSISVYAADKDGAYFIYNMACSEEDAANLTAGTEIKVTGYRSSWAGEIEVAEGATFEFVEGGDTYVAEAKDVTEYVGSDDLANYMNQLVTFTDMTVEAVSYKNDEPGDDIYVTLSKDGTNVEFCLEYYLNGSDEDFYNTVGNLEVGSTVDVTAYLYWYEGADGHLTSVTVK